MDGIVERAYCQAFFIRSCVDIDNKKPDEHDQGGGVAERIKDAEEEQGDKAGGKEGAGRDAEAAEQAGDKAGAVPDKLQEDVSNLGPRRKRPNPRYIGSQWSK
uniref:Uncharacterized protein n=1 Tax=Oryza barthii TaxID=65489 RepID=A0A0D3EK80_9ORYZ